MTDSTAIDQPFWRRPERRVGWQYPLGFVIFILAQGLGTVLGILVNQAVLGPDALDITRHPWPGMAVMLAFEALGMTIGYRLMIRWLARRPVFELDGPGAVRELGIGLAIGAGLMLAVAGVLAAVGVYRITGVSLNTGILVGLMVGVGAAFGEELLFRGVLLRLLDAWLGTWPALVITAVLFGAVHLFNSSGTVWGAIAIMVEAGILLGAAYLLTRRLWLAIGVHLAWNFVQGGILGGNVSGSDLPGPRGLFTSTLSGPTWLTGGPIGVEGSVVTVVLGLAVSVVMLRMAASRGHLTALRGRRADPATQAAQVTQVTQAAEDPAERG